MAIVTILLSCALGAIVGLFLLVFLGASVGQAFVAYGAISVLLPMTIIGLALVIDRFRPVQGGQETRRQDVIETWQDWQTEEAMETNRARNTAERRLDGPDRSRHSTTSPALTTTRHAPSTAFSGRRAGKA